MHRSRETDCLLRLQRARGHRPLPTVGIAGMLLFVVFLKEKILVMSFQTTGMWLLMIVFFVFPSFFILSHTPKYRNETADAYMRLYSEDNKRVTEAVYGRKYKLRVGVNNLDSKFYLFFLVFVLFLQKSSLFWLGFVWVQNVSARLQNGKDSKQAKEHVKMFSFVIVTSASLWEGRGGIFSSSNSKLFFTSSSFFHGPSIWSVSRC